MAHTDTLTGWGEGGLGRGAGADEFQLQLEAAAVSHEHEIDSLVNEPFEVRVAVDGSGMQVDMRPPLLKLKVADSVFAELREQEDAEASIEILVRRVALARVTFGTNHHRVVKAELTLATAYLELASLPEQALQHARRALKSLAVAKGPRGSLDKSSAKGNALTAEVHTLIGGAMVAIILANNNEEPAPAKGKTKGKAKPSVTFAKAQRLLEDALAMCRAKDGEHEVVNRLHAKTLEINAMRHLGGLQRAEGELDTAIKCMEGALLLLNETQIGDHPDKEGLLILLHREMAEIQIARDEFSEAESSLKEAKRLTQDRFGQGSAEVAPLMLQLARLYIADLTDERAERPLHDAVDLYSHHKAFGPEHPDTIAVKDELCRLLVRLERFEEATEVIHHVVPIKMELHGEQSAQVAASEFLLGNIKLQQGRHADAIRHLTAAKDMYHLCAGPKNRARCQVEKMLESLTTKGRSRSHKSRDSFR